VSLYTDGSEALVGPLYVPGETCCYNEFEIQHEATLVGMKDNYLLYKEALSEGRLDGSHLALPPYLNAAAALAATGVLRFLLSGKSFLVGRCTRLDFERMSVDYEEVMRLPRCPACSPRRPGHRHLFM
jgi:bacteriocin biosynthesis cyclodehydratase domain-containing protein